MKKIGFTLIELLVVMVILGILTTISLANFRSSQAKARDAQRKHDLKQVANALEAYVADHGSYPEENGGKIMACQCGLGTPHACDWDQDDPAYPEWRELCDENSTVYMIKVPGDPKGDPHYCYWSDGTSYKLYAQLENIRDPEATLASDCGGETYNFGISSTNITP